MKYHYEIRTASGEYSRGNFLKSRKAAINDGCKHLYRYQISATGVEIDTREKCDLRDWPVKWAKS
jgi:hypothetical protein